MPNQSLGLDILNGLSPEERELALDILKQISEQGSSELLDGLKYDDFEEIPVDVDTFLDDPYYLGRGLWRIDPITGERECTLFPYWRDTLKKLFPDNLTTAYNTLILTGAIGLGKAQSLDALVLCEHGYKRMGDLTLADKVFGEDGKLHKILGIFPQGKKKMCRVTFSDGTSTECCDEHLWTTFNIHNRQWRTFETKEFLSGRRNLRDSHNQIRYQIPITAPLQFDEQKHIIDPYIMGVLLGDGCLTYNGATVFCSIDSEIIEEVSNALQPGYELHKLRGISYSINNKIKFKRNIYNQELNRLDLRKTAYFKHIPTEYLFDNVENRIALLQGLMDTDGTIDKLGRSLHYDTTSVTLKDDIQFLVQSLGGTCRVWERKTNYTNSHTGEKIKGALSYRIRVCLPKTICPFRILRKKNRINPKAIRPLRGIVDVQYIDDAECQCIYVDNPTHLYLTNDCIVTHNTLVGVLALLYLLHRILCLKDPYAYYGMQPIDKISISLLNITIDAAKGVGWDKLNQLVQCSPWFMAHGEVSASQVAPEYRPGKNVELIYGSNNRHIVGRALFANMTDEVNFGVGNNVEKQKAKQKKMISQIDARMRSRFMKGTYLPTLNIIISSKDTEQAFLDSYIETKKENESKTTLIIDEPQWVVRPDKGTPNDPGAFYVAVGNKFLAHELLPENATEEEVEVFRAKGYTMMKVPPGFRESFEDNLDGALTDIAGISVSSTTRYISGVRLNQAKVDTYVNPFTKDVIEVGNAEDDKYQYANFFDLSRVSQLDIARPLFIHLDMSTSGDKTGIAGVWITGKRPSQGEEDTSKELQYKLAFSVSIKAPKGFQISYEKNRSFIHWLRSKGFNIKGVSADTYQSTSTLQLLKADGFNTQVISVDRIDHASKVCQPYFDFKSAIYERRIQIYRKCDLLTEELVNLERLSDGKIDHPENGSKDQADACCGALFLASKFSEEYAYSYGENLEVSLSVSLTESDDYNKRQMILDFEEELKKIYSELLEVEEEKNNSFREEYQMYRDVSDGIICV